MCFGIVQNVRVPSARHGGSPNDFRELSGLWAHPELFGNLSKSVFSKTTTGGREGEAFGSCIWPLKRKRNISVPKKAWFSSLRAVPAERQAPEGIQRDRAAGIVVPLEAVRFWPIYCSAKE